MKNKYVYVYVVGIEMIERASLFENIKVVQQVKMFPFLYRGKTYKL